VGTKDGSQARWTAKDAERVLSAWRMSGMSMSAFAKSRGLKEQRLSWWKKRIAEWSPGALTASAERRPRFVPAVLGAAIPAMGSPPLVAIRLSDGTVVEIGETERVAAKWICELVAALRG